MDDNILKTYDFQGFFYTMMCLRTQVDHTFCYHAAFNFMMIAGCCESDKICNRPSRSCIDTFIRDLIFLSLQQVRQRSFNSAQRKDFPVYFFIII